MTKMTFIIQEEPVYYICPWNSWTFEEHKSVREICSRFQGPKWYLSPESASVMITILTSSNWSYLLRSLFHIKYSELCIYNKIFYNYKNCHSNHLTNCSTNWKSHLPCSKHNMTDIFWIQTVMLMPFSASVPCKHSRKKNSILIKIDGYVQNSPHK